VLLAAGRVPHGRLVGAVLGEQHDERAEGRGYLGSMYASPRRRTAPPLAGSPAEGTRGFESLRLAGPLDQVQSPGGVRVGDGGAPVPAQADAPQPGLAHQPLDRLRPALGE
jgi:hypothetical protein